MEESRKRSPQSEFWNTREKWRKGGKKVVTHSTMAEPMGANLEYNISSYKEV